MKKITINTCHSLSTPQIQSNINVQIADDVCSQQKEQPQQLQLKIKNEIESGSDRISLSTDGDFTSSEGVMSVMVVTLFVKRNDVFLFLIIL